MRLDDYISTVGIVKRRTIAKQLADKSMVMINGRNVKASYQIKLNDIVTIKGSQGRSFEVIEIPSGSVPKTDREKYFKEITSTSNT